MSSQSERALEAELKSCMGQNMHSPMGMSPPDPQRMIKEAPALIKRIKKKNPEQCSDEFRMTAVQFFIQYYTFRMFTMTPMPDPAEIEKLQAEGKQYMPPPPDKQMVELFKADQARDLAFAWKLLDKKFRTKQHQQMCFMFRIELGQRLESSSKLIKALDEIDLNKEEMQCKMVGFTACPIVGRWKTFLDVGACLPPQALQQFSEMSREMPVPDYSVLYQICKDRKLENLPEYEELPWQTYHISSIRVKFKDLDCEDFTDKRDELLKEIQQSEENTKWEEVPNPNHVALRRMGAIWQCMSFAEQPQQLCGIFEKGHIRVQGNMRALIGPPDVDPQDLYMGRVDPSLLSFLVQEENWDLEKDPEDDNLYKGTYKMHNYTPEIDGKKVTDPEKAPLHMTFELEVKICSENEYEQLLKDGKITTEEKKEEEIEKIKSGFDDLELD